MSNKGSCKLHGEVNLWTACGHIIHGKAKNIILAEPKTAMCFKCANRIYELDVGGFESICEQCLRDIVNDLLKLSETDEDVKNIIVGLERLGNVKLPESVKSKT